MAYGVILGQSFGKGLNAKLYVTYGSGAITNLTSVTATAQTSGKVYNGVYDSTNQRYIVDVDSYDIYSVTGTLSSGVILPVNSTVNTAQIYNITLTQFNTALNNTDWNTISLISQDNLGDSVWAVGDAKQIVLNGNVGLFASFDNLATYVYIIGFNHNQATQGKGITFGGFSTSLNNGTNIALTDTSYSSTSGGGGGGGGGGSGGQKFAMNYNTSQSNGGWAGSQMRYNILGSTDVAPTYNDSNIGVFGNNPTSTCATDPVTDSLMAALPSDLRAVMKPMTIYTDNVGVNLGNLAQNVTTSIDYLPLLSEREVFSGETYYANPAEATYQSQYAYYANGNSKIKYQYNSTGNSVYWWLRSPAMSGGGSGFCAVSTTGTATYLNTNTSRGIAPIFMV